MEKTIKEAILKSLKEINRLANHQEVCQHIISQKHYDFKEAKTPAATVSATLGEFIRKGDTRISRIKNSEGSYSYYLTANQQGVGEKINQITESITDNSKTVKYNERDLHQLLSSYLKNTGIYSKTVYHEQSKNSADSSQIWTHPDMVGIKFLNLNSKVSQGFLKSINKVASFNINSYELKREINSDSELKKAFFQAVSNSSWANYGYLVAFEFGENLMEEMERLNQAFGIGIIELNSNPYRSKILFQPKRRELDFKTIDKLCRMNKDFENFIEQVEKLMSVEEKFYKGTEKEMEEFCDKFFMNDSEVLKYCKEKNIPIDEE